MIFKAVRSRGGVVTKTIVESVATALIKRRPELNLDHIDIQGSSSAQSLLRRMTFVRRFGTTGKVPISDDEKSFLYGVVSMIERNNIPPFLVLNLDQTPSKYVPTSNKTMAQKAQKQYQ